MKCKLMLLLMVVTIGLNLEAKVPKVKPFNLSIGSIIKNEAPYLEEWIEYHRLIGVDHFYLYNIGSEDNYKKVLEPYQEFVTLIDWPPTHFTNQNDAMWALGIQIPAYENLIHLNAKNHTKWLVFVDVDEFIVPACSDSLLTILETYGDKPGITISSSCFNGKSPQDTKDLVIRNVMMIKPPKPVPQKEVAKTIFKPEQYQGFVWPPYQCKFKENQTPIRISKSELRINKYLHRSKDSVYVEKLKDQLHLDNRSLSEEVICDLLNEGYEIEDHEQAIFRFVPTLLEKIASIPR